LKLVLVGFELAAEWAHILQEFPKALPLFSSWLDVRHVASDIAPVGCIPGRVSTLQIVGYHWQDIRPAQSQGDDKSGTADNAGDDAVSTLALAERCFTQRTSRGWYTVNSVAKLQESLRWRKALGFLKLFNILLLR
jgi:hypothetical protein